MKSAAGRKSRRRQRGYVLLTLLLVMSMLVIAAGVAASSIAFNIRRDREEELIHRGVQYTRAIRAYSKKTGRFPMRMEELDNVNGLHFLRKHYKDPITGQDFKLVYMSEVVTFGPPLGTSPTNVNDSRGLNPPNPVRNGGNDQAQPSATTDPNQASQPDASSGSQNPSSAASHNSANSDQPAPAGLIVGVVSKSKEHTIREFHGKNRYDQWRFYYDPAFDKFALINAPTMKPFPEAPKLAGASTPSQTNTPGAWTPPPQGYQ
jgi:type II secretory pathway pseudopilin PulG